jgi:indolepyruvate ferredoxin oxidoreductase
MTQALMRTDYRLADSLEATSGQVFLTGTQALIRLALMQSARDDEHGIRSAGFISGYRGSPLGMVDQAAWKAAALLDSSRVRFLPAINEELGATAVLGPSVSSPIPSAPPMACSRCGTARGRASIAPAMR